MMFKFALVFMFFGDPIEAHEVLGIFQNKEDCLVATTAFKSSKTLAYCVDLSVNQEVNYG